MEKTHCARAAALLAFLLVSSALLAGNVSADQGVCNMTQDGLSACKPACSSSAKPIAKPSDACCAALSHADLQCLCSYKNSPLLPYFGIDPKLAVALPAKCNITGAADQC